MGMAQQKRQNHRPLVVGQEGSVHGVPQKFQPSDLYCEMSTEPRVMGDDVGMEAEDIIETLRKKFARVAPVLDERGRRVWAAAEAEALGYGGQGLVAKATGLARTTLYREGVRQAQDHQPSGERIRRVGGGRKKLTIRQPELRSALEALVDPDDPRRSRKPVALDVLEYPSIGGHLNRTGLSHWPSSDGSSVG